MTSTPPRPRSGWLTVLAPGVLLALLAALRPLAVPDEGRYADISRWMLVSGDWLVPRLDGLPFFHKPPLTHWLQAASLAVFGVTPWAARLPGVLLACLMLAGVYAAGRRLAGEPLARRAALMLGASGGFLIGGQYVNHDIGVAAWIASAIWCFVLALWDGERPHAGWARAGFAACALGLLTKGLIGVALPGLVIGSWLLATRQWRKIIHLPWVSGLALFVAIALPWFWRAGERYPGLWSYLFGVQQFSRYTSSGFNNVQPWWFYLAGCLLLLFPWAFLAVYEGVARWRGKAPAAPDDPTRRLAVLCWIWLGAIVLFFSIPRSKLIGYILPVLPPLALLAALGWQRALAARPRAGRWFAAAWLLAAALPVAITLAAPRIEGGKLSRDVAAELACRAAPGDPIYALGGYPMDLPFTAQTQQPLRLVQDWARTRAEAGDTWARELFEAGDFEPATARRILLQPEVLAQAARQPHAWLLAPRDLPPDQRPLLAGWQPVSEGQAWALYRSAASAAEGPETSQHEGLPGCHAHGGKQRQP
ncbi:MAG: glycosyltransferase family 39 protein [Burkholderiaceae bacterium]|nr:glycosyltransferase family 39 protein [Pseudomonadota bacterium]MBS0596417.1 glycosyltransferase family 39 protein [Pseudomonadota bacterium]MCO5117191.1 glycosyltransferase family 39 protein [Burkholderiaceae bacterium]MCP5216791.1 glycosyltransferase family 39 protein [Burkholderiaceae bacterium]